MEYRIIKSPSRGTLEILARRKGSGNAVKLEDVDAVGLVQGRLIEMVCAADVAEKAVGVTVEDIRGSCSQKKFDGEKRRERRNGNSKTDRKYLGNTKIRPSKRI